MKSKFEQLCGELNLTPHAPSEAALLALKHWYAEQVSSERSVQDIVMATRHYLEFFLPNLPAEMADNVLAFNNMNTVQYAATMGYNRFLAELPPSEKGLYNLAIERNGMTPLHLAASHGWVHAVEVLLQKGALPTKKNTMGQYPIYSALFTPVSADDLYRKRKVEIFNALKRAAPNTVAGQDDSGETVANLAVMHGYVSIVSDLIQSHRSSFFTPDNFMKYPIHYAVMNNQLRVISLLLADQGIAELADSDGRVALHYAARSTNTAVLKACLPFYDDLDIRDLMHKTPLLYAAEAGNFDGLQVLVKHKADVHATDFHSSGVLHYATMSSNLDMVRWILDNLSLNINTLDNAGKTALDYANQEERVDISSLLVERGAVKGEPGLSPH